MIEKTPNDYGYNGMIPAPEKYWGKLVDGPSGIRGHYAVASDGGSVHWLSPQAMAVVEANVAVKRSLGVTELVELKSAYTADEILRLRQGGLI